MRYFKILFTIIILLYIGNTYAQNQNNSSLTKFIIPQGGQITLHCNSAYAVEYQWYRDSSAIGNATDKSYTTTSPGIYSVIAFNSEGCPSERSDEVDVAASQIDSLKPAPLPEVDLSIAVKSSNSNVKPGDTFNYTFLAGNNSTSAGTNVAVTWVVPEVLSISMLSIVDTSLSYDLDSRTLKWSINKLLKDNPQTLTVGVNVIQPGSAESWVRIKGREPDPVLTNNSAQTVQQVSSLSIPNVFTPNGDGVNDTFQIPGLEVYADNEIMIMNRSGSSVYDQKNYKSDWTGSGLLEGTYYYILKVKESSGSWTAYKGYITLLRSRMQ